MRIGLSLATLLSVLSVSFASAQPIQPQQSTSTNQPSRHESDWIKNPYGQKAVEKKERFTGPLDAIRSKPKPNRPNNTLRPNEMQNVGRQPSMPSNDAQAIAKPTPVPVRQYSSAGPLDKYVRNTSGFESLPINEPSVVIEEIRPMLPERVADHSGIAPTLNSNSSARKHVKLEPYAHTPHADPVSHIHADARMRREMFDPAQCNFDPPPSRDLSNCRDEWSGFCSPRRLAWECDCEQFPRPETGPCGTCNSCQSHRRRALRGCGCQNRLLNQQGHGNGGTVEPCGQPNCQCQSAAGEPRRGLGLFRRRSELQTSQVTPGEYEYQPSLETIPRGLSYEKDAQSSNLLDKILVRSKGGNSPVK